MISTQPQVLIGIGSFSLALYAYLKLARNRALSLPPGPKKLPIIGNLLEMPKSFEWETFHRWSKEHDTDIIHLNVVGTSIIVLDTIEAANELLDNRSSIYSDRARLPMINELMGWSTNFAFMPYGEKWRQRRKLMHHAFNPSAVAQFHPHELKATHELLRRLLDTPRDFMAHLQYLAGATIMSIAYGIEVLPHNDPFVEIAEEGGRTLMTAAVPGTFLVDSIPLLKYVPEWMPFAGFKRKAREWRKVATDMVELPFQAAKRQLENGTSIPSFTSYSLERMDESGDIAEQEAAIQSTAGTMYVAGSDSTITIIATCILALLTHPEVQKKAQQEIDSVLRHGDLPDFSDEEALPYVSAVVKESLRWKPAAPMAIPHFLAVEDTYKGYRIPAGSIVIANTWAMLQNEEVYPDPQIFNPDRFMKDGKLDPDARDPALSAFGFGRRVCPAQYMAYSAVWITVANILAAFDIMKTVDENGRAIEPTMEYFSTLVCKPVPFECNFKPRSKEVETSIRASIHNDYSFGQLL